MSVSTVVRAQTQVDNQMHYAGTVCDGYEVEEAVDLRQVFADVRQDLMAQFEDAEARIFLDELPVIFASSAQARVLCQNLVSNAIKYRHPDVPPVVHVTSEIDASAKQIRLHVTDNGMGIDPRYHKRIFEMFKRLHRHDQIPGSGLGLSALLRVARNLDGDLSVSSEPRIGSTFSLCLPVERTNSWPKLAA